MSFSSRRIAAVGLCALIAATQTIPAIAAGSQRSTTSPSFRFVAPPPPGVTITRGVPNHKLALRATYEVDPRYLRQVVLYQTHERPGTLVVDTSRRHLYLVLPNGRALRYGIGVARSGFEWSGTHRITNKREWPGWTPPAEMRQRQPELPSFMPGGPENPLGARALYIGSTLYRIHGTNQPWTIGGTVSSGCIRMINDDVIDLYRRVKIGAKVVVL